MIRGMPALAGPVVTGRRVVVSSVAAKYAGPRLYIALLAVVLGYGVLKEGGRSFTEWNVCLLLLGLVAFAYWLRARHVERAPIGPWLAWAVVLAPAYVALQLVPLPLSLLRVLSPARAEIAASLGTVMQPPTTAALSISPTGTLPYLLNVLACALTFLLIREITWRSRQQEIWAPAIPLIVIAAIEAGLGLWQAAGGSDVQGTYRSKNHFAGLLEMVLPMSVAYALALSARRIRGTGPTFNVVLWTGGILSLAGMILFALAYSGSKMGFVSGLCGLFVMGVLGLVTTLRGTAKWLGVAGLAASCLLAFLVLPTDQIVSNFGHALSDDIATGEGRWPIWRDSVHLLANYPLFGCGLGNYGTAFLRYQTSGVDFHFTFAHNDYVQLTAELGAVGVSIFAGLAVIVLARAIRATSGGQDWNSRTLGLGCVGAIAAISVHSLADFNMYIPANALLLAWISGIAVCLPVCAAPEQEESSGASFSTNAVVLASALVLYAPAWMVFETMFHSNPGAERLFCRFGICDTDALVAAEVQNGDAPVAAAPVERLLEGLRRDAAAPHRWCDLGEAMLKAGRTQQAKACLSTALALGPNIPPVLLRAADFYHGLGEVKVALAQTSRLLAISTTYDADVFDWYRTKKIPVTDILASGLPDGPRASQAYLRRLLRSRDAARAALVWNWLLSQGHADDRVAADYVDFLYKRGKYEGAAESWAAYLGDRRNGYLESNWLFNGDFESEPSGIAFDWKMESLGDDVEVTLDSTVARAGSRSLRVRFKGKENVNYGHTFETTAIGAGLYRFQAYIRAQGITTDQGVGFHIFDPKGSGHVDVTTERIVGTNDWKRIEQIVKVPSETRLLTVQVVRPRSLKFDSNIAGTAWIDDVSLTKIE